MAEFKIHHSTQSKFIDTSNNGDFPVLRLRDEDSAITSTAAAITAQNQVLSGLSEAAARIDEAARKLSKVQARRTIYLPTDVPLTGDDFSDPRDYHDPVFEFDENVLDSCKAIMAASAALIPAAGKAQEELVRFGRVNVNAVDHYSEESQWSQGFISAARAIGTWFIINGNMKNKRFIRIQFRSVWSFRVLEKQRYRNVYHTKGIILAYSQWFWLI